ncbi:MAG: M23 family metallopeptidase, partial [Nanoarchaeota archaeon]
MKGKKGMGLSILAGIGFLLAVCLFLVISSNARILDRGAGNIGAIPLDVIRARYAGEQALLFLDYSAKYSLPYAILATGDSGGLADAPCGAYISSLWNTNVSICPPNVSSALKQAFDDRLHVYLNQYPNIPVHTYQYQIDSNNVKVSLLGFSSEDLIIPMTKTGTGFAELSDMGGGLVFPVEGNPIITSCFGDRILDSGPNNHDGLDFRTEQVNTKIFAIAPGQVVSVCEEWVGVCDCSVASSPKAGRACNPKNGCWMKCGNLGNTVLIKHAENFYSRYSHLSSVEVQVGDQISGGMFIAFSGDTGYSEAPHLDLKIYTTSDTSGKQGKNALCIYSDDQLATLTSSADSCK